MELIAKKRHKKNILNSLPPLYSKSYDCDEKSSKIWVKNKDSNIDIFPNIIINTKQKYNDEMEGYR